MHDQDLSILNWNVRGLGEDDKCSLVHDTITSCYPSVICLEETKLSSVSPFKLRAFLPLNLKEHAATLSDGAARGILVA